MHRGIILKHPIYNFVLTQTLTLLLTNVILRMKTAYPIDVAACGGSLLYLNRIVVNMMTTMPIIAQPPMIVGPCAASCSVRVVECTM